MTVGEERLGEGYYQQIFVMQCFGRTENARNSVVM